MPSKHNSLTLQEFQEYEISSEILELIERFSQETPELKKKDIHILDWGCGRGRTVLKLLERGYSAVGVDVDHDVLENGSPLFKEFGYDPEQHLMPVTQLNKLPDNAFHLIVTEQVLEHVDDISQVIDEQSRLTAPGGYGFHAFPASKSILEVHLHMPFVHWLPKNELRRYWIALMLMLSFKPNKVWPETEGKSFSETVEVYYDYMNQKTFYRDIRHLGELFEDKGFQIILSHNPPSRSFLKILPNFLLMNGFPQQPARLIVRKR